MVFNYGNVTNELLTKTELNKLSRRDYLQNLTNHIYLNPVAPGLFVYVRLLMRGIVKTSLLLKF